MISFIVPAHNEEAWVGRSVSAIRNGADSLGEPHEIIVVDDASSDATASIARQQGAQVVRVEHRQIDEHPCHSIGFARYPGWCDRRWLCAAVRGMAALVVQTDGTVDKACDPP